MSWQIVGDPGSVGSEGIFRLESQCKCLWNQVNNEGYAYMWMVMVVRIGKVLFNLANAYNYIYLFATSKNVNLLRHNHTRA